eukprot:s4054_g14.t1
MLLQRICQIWNPALAKQWAPRHFSLVAYKNSHSHFGRLLEICWISAATQVKTSGSLDLLRWPTMQLTSTRRQFLRLFVGTFALVLLCRRPFDGGEAFVPMTGNHESMSRRGLLGAALPAVLGGPGAASAMTQGITDVVEYMNRRKRELVPYMKQGIDYLESHEIDERCADSLFLAWLEMMGWVVHCLKDL